MFSSSMQRPAVVPISQFSQLLSDKKIDENVFYADPRPSIKQSPIAQHAHWAYETIYSVHYPKETKETLIEHAGIARYHHGIQHSARVAFYIPIFVNLYRRFSDNSYLKNISSDVIKLLQIAALFHDAARENEKVDRWDEESGLMLFFYLLSIGAKEAEAALFASVIANKDKEGHFQFLAKDEKGEYRFCKPVPEDSETYLALTTLIDLLHDADSLDIIRARDHFSAMYLHFYKKFAEKNPKAKDEMARLVAEIRSLIEIQGDSRLRIRNAVKKDYENSNVWQAIIASVDPVLHPLLTYLFANGDVIPEKDKKEKILPDEKYDRTKGVEEKNVQAALRERQILCRAVVAPSALRMKESKTLPKETLIHQENRKMFRRLGVKTNAGNLDRDGSDNRSVVLLADGVPPFGCVGGLKIGFDLEDVFEIYAVDRGTSRGKKDRFKKRKYNVSNEEKSGQLEQLVETVKMGGSSVRFLKTDTYAWSHNEIHYRIRDIDTFFFSQDPTIYEHDSHGGLYPVHPLSPKLQAVYEQNEYFNMTGKLLPIYEYSGIHCFIRRVTFSVEQIQQMWIDLCVDFIRKELAKDCSTIYTMSLDDIKILAMYGTKENHYAKCNMPADDNYPESIYGKDFFAKINETILKEKETLIAEDNAKTLSRVQHNEDILLNDSTFWKVLNSNLIMTPDLQKLALVKSEEMLADLEDCELNFESLSASLGDAEVIGNLRVNKNDVATVYDLSVNAAFNVEVKLYLIAKKLEVSTREVLDHVLMNFTSRSITKILRGQKFETKFVVLLNLAKMFRLFELDQEYIKQLEKYIRVVIKSTLESTTKWYLYHGLFLALREMGFGEALLADAKEAVQTAALTFATAKSNPKSTKEFTLLTYLELAEWTGISFENRLAVIEKYFLANPFKTLSEADLKKIGRQLNQFLVNDDQLEGSPLSRLVERCKMLIADAMKRRAQPTAVPLSLMFTPMKTEITQPEKDDKKMDLADQKMKP